MKKYTTEVALAKLCLMSVFSRRKKGKINLTDCNLNFIELSSIKLDKSFLVGCSFNAAFLQHVSFEQAWLSSSDFTNAYIHSCSFAFADLYNTNFIDADLYDVDFSYATVLDATFPSVYAGHKIPAIPQLDRRISENRHKHKTIAQCIIALAELDDEVLADFWLVSTITLAALIYYASCPGLAQMPNFH